MGEVIKFHPLTEEVGLVVPPPKPAKLYLPKWYRDIQPVPEHKKKYDNGDLTKHSVKNCMPFLDSMVSGYIQETWCDIHIGPDDNGNIRYNYPMDPEIISARDSQAHVPDGFMPIEFTWRQPYGVETPEGWSVIMTHPFNHTQLPYMTLTGIVDSDLYFREPFPNNFPFFLRNGFNGIIPAGSPMFQIIPFKRAEWTHEVTEYDEKANKRGYAPVRKAFQYGYRKAFWQRKSFS